MLEEMGIPFAGEDHYNSLVLIHEGVPAEAIAIGSTDVRIARESGTGHSCADWALGMYIAGFVSRSHLQPSSTRM